MAHVLKSILMTNSENMIKWGQEDVVTNVKGCRCKGRGMRSGGATVPGVDDTWLKGSEVGAFAFVGTRLAVRCDATARGGGDGSPTY